MNDVFDPARLKVPTVSTTEELLSLLREAPAMRCVVPLGSVAEGFGPPLAVAEIDAHHSEILATLSLTGTAVELIRDVTRADTDAALDDWAALPLRFTGGACVLPEHPDAPGISSRAFETQRD